MLNDCIFLLDEQFKVLLDIKQYQDEFDNKIIWENYSKEEQNLKTENFKKNEKSIVSYCLLSRETLNMLSFISKEVPSPFMKDEMIDRVAW
jgi:ubiquitin conjugation factor E4 B